MIEIVDKPGEYVVSRNGVVIGCAVLCGDGLWRAATLAPVDLRRTNDRDSAVALVQRATGVLH